MRAQRFGVRSERRFAGILVLALGVLVASIALTHIPLIVEAKGTGLTFNLAAAASSPLDATPDPQAHLIYFTGQGTSDGERGVFWVPASGGTAAPLAVGRPFASPMGLAISTDGRRLYVADPEADAIFVVPTNGDGPRVLRGTEGTAPLVPDVVNHGGGDEIYYSGRNPSDGLPAVFKIAAEGGHRSIIAKGSPFVDPRGVAVAGDGSVYVSDRAASGGGLGAIFRVVGSHVQTIAANVRTGSPVSGLALTQDDSTLLVSALHPHHDSARVLVIDLATGGIEIVDQGIKQNVGAGGIHRAHDVDQFAWCGTTVGDRGTVFQVILK